MCGGEKNLPQSSQKKGREEYFDLVIIPFSVFFGGGVLINLHCLSLTKYLKVRWVSFQHVLLLRNAAPWYMGYYSRPFPWIPLYFSSETQTV